ncbi:hypothetical protein CARUB_v10011216mg [Capsella rubella]|uniref:MADS-box domain-containing protein n=1 Tax=Capsella rubella TaxID=81985 RepID=R0IK32_9BRAS|nr:agamous-like MADS-box protein AGL61 [Capsella rubella]EOA38860.1 hypothetical protein CARUB_v10011216mg [Capsella rubella]
MSSKKTKGKQKIHIQKIERDKDRLVTLSKRRNGIYTKLCELSVLCGAQVAFLGYSGSGKPYTFGSPSFQAVVERFLNGQASSSSSSLQQSLFDAHYEENVQELCRLYNNMVEQTRVEEAKTITAATSVEPLPKDAWWKVDLTEVEDQEKKKQWLEKFERLYENMCDELDAKRQQIDDAENEK